MGEGHGVSSVLQKGVAERSKGKDACCSASCHKVPCLSSRFHSSRLGWVEVLIVIVVVGDELRPGLKQALWLPQIAGCSQNCIGFLVPPSSHISQVRKSCHFSAQNTLMAFHLTQNKIQVLALAYKAPTWSGPTPPLAHALTLFFCSKSSLGFSLLLDMSECFHRRAFALTISSASNSLIMHSQGPPPFLCKSCPNVTLSARPSLTILYKIASSDNLNS